MKICWVSRWFEALHVQLQLPLDDLWDAPIPKVHICRSWCPVFVYLFQHAFQQVCCCIFSCNKWLRHNLKEQMPIWKLAGFHFTPVPFTLSFSRYRPQLAFVRYPWPQLGFSLRVSIKFPYAFGGTTQPSGPVCAGGCVTAMPAFTESSLDGHSNAGGWDFFWWNLMAKVSTNGPTNTAVRAMMWLLPSRRMECDVLRFWIFSMEENIRTLYGVIITI